MTELIGAITFIKVRLSFFHAILVMH
jgi:hypothetical protein